MQWCWGKAAQQSLEFIKDDFIDLGIQHDFTELWEGGKKKFSDRCAGTDIQSLLKHYFSSSVLGGQNKATCDSTLCQGSKQVHFQHTEMTSKPAQLILTIKRMGYDSTKGRTIKHLDPTPFHPTLSLPGNPERTRYGLYAVIVHKGKNANSGHYVTYARHSKAADVSDRNSPWIVFNDSRVATSSWGQMVSDIVNSPHDTTYMLFYRKITTINEALTEKEDDEKLLKQAMQLSSSLSSENDPSIAQALAGLSSLSTIMSSSDPLFQEQTRKNEQTYKHLECLTSTAYRELVAAQAMLLEH